MIAAFPASGLPLRCPFCDSRRLDAPEPPGLRCEDCGAAWWPCAAEETPVPSRFLYARCLPALLGPVGEAGLAFAAGAPDLAAKPDVALGGLLAGLAPEGVLVCDLPAAEAAAPGWRASADGLRDLLLRIGAAHVALRRVAARNGAFLLAAATRDVGRAAACDGLLDALTGIMAGGEAALQARLVFRVGRLGEPVPDPADLPDGMAAPLFTALAAGWAADRNALAAARDRADALAKERNAAEAARQRAASWLEAERSDHRVTRRRLTGALIGAPADEAAPAVPAPGTPGAPLVTVVIPCFNYGATVGEAIASALAQTWTDLEVIVIEGGSSDAATRQAVAALSDPRVRVLMQGAAHRVGANRELGIASARGRYLLCLDADDALHPTYVEKALYLLERGGYDIVSAGIELVGAETGTVRNLRRPDLAALVEANHILTCAVFRRALWEQAGGYRDAPPDAGGHVHEDWAFWLRLAALGARVCNMGDDFLLRYRVHASSLSRGKHVLLPDAQREAVRAMNEDVLTPDAIARSTWLRDIRRAPPPLPGVPAAAGTRSLILALPWMVLGGAERLLVQVVEHLVSSGWRVSIVTSLEPGVHAGDTTPWFAEHTAEIFALPRFLDPPDWPDFLLHLAASREADTLMIVGSAFAYDNLPMVRAARPGLRVVDLLFNTVGHVANNRRRRRHIDLNIVESGEVRDWLLAQGEAPSRVRLIPSAVDLDRAHPRLRTGALRTRLGVPDGHLLIGFSGRWSEEKNPAGFIELAARAPREWPVRFVMTGTGPQRAELERALADPRLPAGRLQLLGVVDDVLPVLADLDLLIVPSHLDGRPVVILESLAVGTPVVASRVGGIPELVRPGETGFLCETGDVEGLLATLSAIVAGQHDLAALRRQARAYAEGELDRGRMLTAFEAALASGAA